MQKTLLFILITLLLTACTQKNPPTIDGENSRFINNFYPAKIDSKYFKGDIRTLKSPIIFLFNGYEGVWRDTTKINRLQEMGYHVVSVGYYTKSGLSNNLSRVNIDEIKRIMDRYKKYKNVDTNAIGVVGRGKGAELALLLASYYPDIKMVVGISAPHVVFQASRATLMTHSSWVHEDEEVDFVAYPKFSPTAVRSIFRLMRRKINDFRFLHDLAIEDEEAVKKARIKVENIKGDIFLASIKQDKMWNSVLMSQEIMKNLKERGFAHRYEHKSYKGKWFLQEEESEKGWGDIYHFISGSLETQYLREKFRYFDKDSDKKHSFKENLAHAKEEKDDFMRSYVTEQLYQCDTNHNDKIDYHELTIGSLSSDSFCGTEVYYVGEENYLEEDKIAYENRPIIKNRCSFGQYDFEKLDLNKDGTVTLDEIHQVNSKKDKDRSYIYYRDGTELESIYKEESAKDRFTLCDKNRDSEIDAGEANAKECLIDASILKLADSRGGSLSFEELLSLPTKYAPFRKALYRSEINGEILYEMNIPDKIIFSYLMSECDTNYDLNLEKSEVTSPTCGFSEQEFLDADLSKDGFLTQDDIELSRHFQSFKERDENSDGQLSFDEWVGLVVR